MTRLSGIFVTLSDRKTLDLYLDRGVYGFLMPPVKRDALPNINHYRALADYACIRDGTHVFFFRAREITYGGQVVGSGDFGSFYLNGPYSPLGRTAKAELCWDESERENYGKTGDPGVFTVPDRQGEKCQPFIITFEDQLSLKGRAIKSDDLYWELAKYPYPLPSNSISGMSFCTLTPCETEIAIHLLRESKKPAIQFSSSERVELRCGLTPFDINYGVSNARDAFEASAFANEAHLEASLLANPELLPEEMRPKPNYTLCRQIPMCPFKPSRMDRVDIGYYDNDDKIFDGSLPNVIIEIKINKIGKGAVDQVNRYLDWIYRVARKDFAERVTAFIYGPSIARGAEEHIKPEYRQQVKIEHAG